MHKNEHPKIYKIKNLETKTNMSEENEKNELEKKIKKACPHIREILGQQYGLEIKKIEDPLHGEAYKIKEKNKLIDEIMDEIYENTPE